MTSQTLWDLPDEFLLSSREVEQATNGALTAVQLARSRYQGWGPEFLKTGTGINGRVSYQAGEVKRWLESRRASNTAQAYQIGARDRESKENGDEAKS